MMLVVSAIAPAARAGQRKQMIRDINAARGWNHERGLHFSRRLSRGAGAWARYLMQHQTLMHAGGQQGEVIEWHTGGGPQIQGTVDEWMNSPGHRQVMLGSYARAGAGKAVGYFGGRLCTIWVVRFAG